MKSFFFTLFMAFGLSLSAQTTINLTEDLVLSETLVISEDVTYNGNGFKLICNGCEPAILVKKGIRAHFQDVKFVKTYAKWLRVEGGDMSNVTWNSNQMNGHIRFTGGN